MIVKFMTGLSRSKSKSPTTAVQFSGATWHPACYDYEAGQRNEISRKKKNSKLIAIKNTIKHLNPDYYLPSAGPAVFPFLHQDLSVGEGSIFVHQEVIAELFRGLETKPIYLRPGERFDANKTVPIAAPTKAELSALAKTLPNVWADTSRQFDASSLLAAVQRRLDEIRGLCFEQCPQIVLRWGDGEEDGITIDLNRQDASIGNEIFNLERFYCIEADEKYFALMSDDRVRWQDLALSFRAKLTRNPDVFSTFVNMFLYSDVSNIKKSFTTTLNISEERVVRLNEKTGKTYEFGRYCPHNGADLIDAEIDESGHLICPRHAWRFNLAEGGKCPENDSTINALEVENTITLCETISARLVKQ